MAEQLLSLRHSRESTDINVPLEHGVPCPYDANR